MANYKIVSVKGNKQVVGTLDEAIAAAEQMHVELSPAYGVQIENELGELVWDSEASEFEEE